MLTPNAEELESSESFLWATTFKQNKTCNRNFSHLSLPVELLLPLSYLEINSIQVGHHEGGLQEVIEA